MNDPANVTAQRRGPEHALANSTRPWMWLALITLVGAALRFYRLDGQSLWLDEISSLRNAKVFGTGGINALAGIDQVAPLHSIVLWIATIVGNDGAVSLRIPSVLAGIATIPVTWWVAVRLFGSQRVGLVAAALVAVSPFAIWYSQEGRMYALLLLAATAYVGIAWPVAERALRPAELVLLTIVTGIGLGMHHYMALVCASFGLFLVLRGVAFRRRAWIWLATQIIAFAVFAYWMVLTADRIAGAAGNAKPAVLFWTPYAFYSFLVGFSFGPSTPELALAGQDAVAVVARYGGVIVVVAVAAAALGLLGLRRALRPDVRWAGWWLLIWMGVPIALTILATFVTNIQFNVRYVIVSFSPLVILLAQGVCEIPWRRLEARIHPVTGAPQPDGTRRRRGLEVAAIAALTTLAGCMLIADYNLYYSPKYAKADVRSLARFLDRSPPGVTLVADNNRVAKVLDYYGGRLPAAPLGVDYRFASQSPEAVWRNLTRTPLRAGEQVWLVEYRSWEADPRAYLRARLQAQAHFIQAHDWAGVSVREYRIGDRPQAAIRQAGEQSNHGLRQGAGI